MLRRNVGLLMVCDHNGSDGTNTIEIVGVLENSGVDLVVATQVADAHHVLTFRESLVGGWFSVHDQAYDFVLVSQGDMPILYKLRPIGIFS